MKISPGCSLEGLMLKLKLQNFGHLIQRADSLGKTLKLEQLRAGGERDDRGWHGWMASSTGWTGVWLHSGSWWWTGSPGMLPFIEWWRVGQDWVTELNWSGLGFRGSAPLEYFFYYLGLVIFNLIMNLSRATRSTTESSATERKLWHQDPHLSLPFLEVCYFMTWSAMTLNQRGPRTFLLCVCGSNHCPCCEVIPIIMSQVK